MTRMSRSEPSSEKEQNEEGFDPKTDRRKLAVKTIAGIKITTCGREGGISIWDQGSRNELTPPNPRAASTREKPANGGTVEARIRAIAMPRVKGEYQDAEFAVRARGMAASKHPIKLKEALVRVANSRRGGGGEQRRHKTGRRPSYHLEVGCFAPKKTAKK